MVDRLGRELVGCGFRLCRFIGCERIRLGRNVGWGYRFGRDVGWLWV